ncbi:CBO0543 family protein [Falsibacillus albus]|uniref:Uncharacterized protein n=1 Tax=Falsibacillus albus TaxID=2478915 RepID=A0A3L7JUK9_9BACI|nr:hypothetical protein D9X91_16080 [Falsibacillus albus]
MHLAILIWLAIQNIRKRTWKNIPRFFPSVLYVVIFNAGYYYLCNYKVLWEFKSPFLKTRTIKILHLFFIMPLLILSFLSTYPSNFLRQIVYVIKWVLASSLIEWIGSKFNAITFKNGWNCCWSTFIYLLMFIFSRMILKKPFVTLLLSGSTTAFLLTIFQIPLKVTRLPSFKKFFLLDD